MHPISAIVVNFDGGRELLRCVASLSKSPRRFAEVIVIDNASTDGSPERLLESHPDIVLVRSERNVGPAAARNIGLRQAHSPLVLFIDDDVRLESGALDRLLDCQRHTDATVVVPRLVLVPENVVQADGADVHFTGTMHLRNGRAPLASERPPARPIGTFSSSCVLAERRRVLDAGGFDESFFIYQEDMELGLRLRAFGHALYCEPAAVALHERGGGTPALSFRDRGVYPRRRGFLTMRNRLRTVLLHHEGRSLVLLAPALLLYECASIAFAAKSGWLGAWLEAWRSQWTDRALIRERRRWIQGRRRLGDAELLVGGRLPLSPGLLGDSPLRHAVALLSGAFDLWWRLVSPLLPRPRPVSRS